MSLASVIRFIHSLSKAEKRQFKLFTKKQSGNKDYIDLFDLIDQNRITDKTTLEEKYRKLENGPYHYIQKPFTFTPKKSPDFLSYSQLFLNSVNLLQKDI